MVLILKGIVSGHLWIRWNGQVDILSKSFTYISKIIFRLYFTLANYVLFF